MIFVPLAIGWIASLVLLALDGRRRWVGWLALAAVLGMLAASVALLWEVAAGREPAVIAGGWPGGVGIRLRADWLGIGYAVPVLGIIAALLLIENLRGGFLTRIGPALVVLVSLGLTGVFFTADAFNFYVFFELSMGSAFAITALGTEGRHVRVSATFMVTNILGSVLFLISVGGLYHATGTLDMPVAAARLGVDPFGPPVLVGTLFLAAFLLKLGIFPFHFWVPPVYGETRVPAAALLSGALANIGSYGLLRFGGEVMPDALQAGRGLLLAIGAATILIGSMLAISRQPVAEILAYSSIAQNGYILLALGIGGRAGFAAAYIYAMVNSIGKALLFTTAGSRGPMIGGAFLIGAMSTAGLPPALGFVGKFALFRAAWEGTDRWLVGWIIGGALLAFLYMFQAFQQRFWLREDETHSAPSVRVAIACFAVVALVFGVWPEPLLGAGSQIASLLAGGPR
ncbi:MAG TPA: proton-conducting transporter membrane subunit [Vulgatibacter sp.]|nr:proton-conducting transporter membrane subunit [Vulgatibacter sp.]